MVVLGGVVVAGCVYLVLMEWTRFKRDPSKLPPLDAEVASVDRWHNGVTLAIAALSIVGALLAWRASTDFDAAADLSRQAVDMGVRYQAVRALSDGRIDFDARLSLIYQEHLRAAAALTERAGTTRDANAAAGIDDTSQVDALEAEARIEGAIARHLAASFLTYSPTIEADGSVTYDRDANAGLERAGNADLRTLDPANVRGVAQESSVTRRVAQQLVVAGALFIAAMFFLTVADLGWLHRRLFAAIPAALSAMVALAVLIVAEF